MKRSACNWFLATCLAVVTTVPGCSGSDNDSAQSSDEIEILWDRWGVPHIHAPDEAALFQGFGWAQATSHGDLLLRLIGQARGRAAEYWGAEHADSDRWVRSMGIPARARSWLEAQEPAFRRNLEAFAAGINQYVERHPERIADDVEVVLPVDAVDVLAHTQRVVHFTFVTRPRVAQAARQALVSGSNAWAISPERSASGHAMLLSNPHLSWTDLFTFYEADLEAPGYDAYGATLVGFPMLAIAFNDNLGWTHTVNPIDAADVYELTVEEDGYRFDGEIRKFGEDRNTLRVRQADGSVSEEPLTVLRSVHGPVIAREGAKAVAVRVAGLDQPGMLHQWWDMGAARNLAGFESALARLQIPMFTVMYADRAGHILHFFGGRVPKRPHGKWADWSGVVSGDTSDTLWNETHSYEELPRVVDPRSGWLQNANDPPWTTTFPPALKPENYPPYIAPQGMAFRAQRSVRMLTDDDSITFDELVQYKFSTHMELADRILDELIAAAREHGGELARRAADVLENWDRQAEVGSRGGILFILWARAAQEDGKQLFAKPWSADYPRTTPAGLADPAAAAAALEVAAREVERTYGSLDVAWGDVCRLRIGEHDLPGNGAPDGFGVFRVIVYSPVEEGRFAASGGDSYVALVEFADPVRARVSLSYGNSSQPGSPHAGDQLELVSRKELRPARRTREEIEANLESREVIPVTR